MSISPVGLGGYELGGGDAARGDPSTAGAAEVVEAALAAGINWAELESLIALGPAMAKPDEA